MKKYTPLFIVITLFLFSSCSISGNNSEKNVKEPTNNKEFMFNKKQECVKHQSQIEKDIEKYNWEDKSDRQSAELEEIFYSPEKNSCLYVYRIYKSGSITSGGRNIVDFFTKETLYFANDFCNFGGKDCSMPYDKTQNGYSEKMVTKEILNQKIQKLKGE